MALTKVGKEGITGISNSSDATAITIDSSERVGIGTTSPSVPLQVSVAGSGVTDVLKLTTTDSNTVPAILFEGDVSGTQHDVARIRVQQDSSTDGGIIFETESSGSIAERMRIDSSGNLMVGTTATNGTQGAVFLSASLDRRVIRLGHTGTTGGSQSGLIEFYGGGALGGNITTNGSSTVYSTSSDYRLKENVDYTFDATTRLKQLKPCRFNFIADANTTVDGFLAHEVSSVVPEAISGDKDATDDDGNIVPQGIDQSKLVPLLVKTIQELEARITALEGE